MPIYEYRCRLCGHNFEDLRGAFETDRDLKCPKCGKPNVERMLSSFSTCGSGSDGSGGSCGGGGFGKFS